MWLQLKKRDLIENNPESTLVFLNPILMVKEKVHACEILDEQTWNRKSGESQELGGSETSCRGLMCLKFIFLLSGSTF